MSIPRLEATVNMGRGRLSTLLNILDVQGAVKRVKGGYLRSTDPWVYDAELAERLRALRAAEADQMRAYATHDGCRLHYLRGLLDDAEAADCGRCDRCVVAAGGEPRWSSKASDVAVAEAQDHLRGVDIGIDPRRQWATSLDEPKGKIKPDAQARLGRALARLGDGGWDPVVASLLDGTATEIPPALVNGIVGILKRWDWQQRPTWICVMPSRRHGKVLDALADEIGRLGKLPVHRPLERDATAGWQADQANSAHQLANVWGRITLDESLLPDRPVRDGPVLLFDDAADSRWTITVVANLLHQHDCGPTLPFVLRTR